MRPTNHLIDLEHSADTICNGEINLTLNEIYKMRKNKVFLFQKKYLKKIIQKYKISIETLSKFEL